MNITRRPFSHASQPPGVSGDATAFNIAIVLFAVVGGGVFFGTAGLFQ